MKATYPQALVMEIKKYGMSSTECYDWISQLSTTHTLLRDRLSSTGAKYALGLDTYDVLVMDSALRIVYRGASVEKSAPKAEVMAELATLLP